MKPRAKRITKLRKSEIKLTDLKKKGRLQFFFHAPSSKWPVRDVLGKDKTEPYLEKSAENYCTTCYQPNIVGFLKRSEKYLFLFTTCLKRGLPQDGKRFIVGYIAKKKAILRRNKKKESWWAVQGPTKMFSFDDAYPLPWKRIRGVRRLDEKETADVLQYFKDKKNILRKCLRELRELESVKRERKNASGSSTDRC